MSISLKDIVIIGINLVIISLLIIIYPTCLEHKEMYEKCNYRVLCQKGVIDDPICDDYEYLDIPDSINISVGTTIR